MFRFGCFMFLFCFAAWNERYCMFLNILIYFFVLLDRNRKNWTIFAPAWPWIKQFVISEKCKIFVLFVSRFLCMSPDLCVSNCVQSCINMRTHCLVSLSRTNVPRNSPQGTQQGVIGDKRFFWFRWIMKNSWRNLACVWSFFGCFRMLYCSYFEILKLELIWSSKLWSLFIYTETEAFKPLPPNQRLFDVFCTN